MRTTTLTVKSGKKDIILPRILLRSAWLVLVIPFLFFACAGGPEAVSDSTGEGNTLREELQEFQGGFVLTEAVNSQFSIGATYATPRGTPLRNMFQSRVVRSSDDPGNGSNLGIFVETEQFIRYYWLGEEKNIAYRMIFSNMESLDPAIVPGADLTPGQNLGTAGNKSSPLAFSDDVMISLYTLEPDIYFSLSTQSDPQKQLGVYWYSPNSLVQGTMPSPNPLHYEEVDYPSFDFSDSPMNKGIRGYLSLEQIPAQDKGDYVMLFMSAALSGLLQDFEKRNYSFTSEIEVKGDRVITLWPEDLAQIVAKQDQEFRDHLYLYGRKIGENEDFILFVVDLFSDQSVEESLWQ